MNGAVSSGPGPGFEELSIAICWWGGALLVFIGLLKLVVYAIGELRPSTFEKFESETLRRFFTGRSNRLVFGLGGFLTAGLGGFFMVAAKGMAILLEHTRM